MNLQSYGSYAQTFTYKLRDENDKYSSGLSFDMKNSNLNYINHEHRTINIGKITIINQRQTLTNSLQISTNELNNGNVISNIRTTDEEFDIVLRVADCDKDKTMLVTQLLRTLMDQQIEKLSTKNKYFKLHRISHVEKVFKLKNDNFSQILTKDVIIKEIELEPTEELYQDIKITFYSEDGFWKDDAFKVQLEDGKLGYVNTSVTQPDFKMKLSANTSSSFKIEIKDKGDTVLEAYHFTIPAGERIDTHSNKGTHLYFELVNGYIQIYDYFNYEKQDKSNWLTNHYVYLDGLTPKTDFQLITTGIHVDEEKVTFKLKA